MPLSRPGVAPLPVAGGAAPSSLMRRWGTLLPLVTEALLMFAGGLVGFFIAWLASPWFARPQRRMERFARKHRGVASLEIDIELDSAIIHS